MKKYFFNLVCLLTFSGALCAQGATSKSFKEKLYAGGHLGLTVGDYTNIIASPMLGVRLNDRVNVGGGVEYQYTKDKGGDPVFTYNQYGGRLFAQYNLTSSLFAHTEFAGMSMQRYNTSGLKERNLVPLLYVGGGYRQYVSERSFVSFRVLFDVLKNQNSPYKDWYPLYSIGFGVGI